MFGRQLMCFFPFFSLRVCLHTKQRATAGELLPHKRALTGQSLQSSQWHHHCETLTWVISASQRWNGDEKKGFCTSEKKRGVGSRHRAAEKAGTVRKEGNRRRADKRMVWEPVCARAVLGWAMLGCVWSSIDCWAQTVTHMTCLMWASPYHSALCGAATLSGVTMKCKAAVAKRANYKDDQSTYAPQSWQLDISIHQSEWLWGVGGRWEKRESREGEKKKQKKPKCCFSFNHPVVSCPHSCCGLQDATLQACWFCFRQLSSGGHR